ncbi:MAG: hypothetical protein JNL21_28885 [Myxococcales bacterium]|nr:hypothetical protein [Myxococcales bacterium]
MSFFARTPVALVCLACVTLSAACGGSVIFTEDGGEGGQGGQGGNTTSTVVTSTTSTTKSSSVVTSTTVGPTTTSVTTGPGGCDTGEQATIDSIECQDCQSCTFAPGGLCEDELLTCQGGTCYSYIDCISNCGGPGCEEQCQMMYPDGAAQYQALFQCVVCVDCFNNCEGFNYCFFK